MFEPRDEMQEDLVESWNEWLDEFDQVYQSIFAPRGIDYPHALVVYQTNRLYNKIEELLDQYNSDGPDREPWN